MNKSHSMTDFQRDIRYRISQRSDGAIVLIGTLNDRFHDIEVEICIAEDSLLITEINAAFRAAPSPYCERVQERLKMLEGIRIGKGLTRKLTETLGGEQGCGNLRTMLAGLLPLAMNVKAVAGIDDDQQLFETLHHKLQGSCIGYPRKEHHQE